MAAASIPAAASEASETASTRAAASRALPTSEAQRSKSEARAGARMRTCGSSAPPSTSRPSPAIVAIRATSPGSSSGSVLTTSTR